MKKSIDTRVYGFDSSWDFNGSGGGDGGRVSEVDDEDAEYPSDIN